MMILDRLRRRTDSEADAHWRTRLSPQQFRILRRGGTERPFTGEHVHTDAAGVYRCAACGSELFDSSAKFDSGTGWPSFTDPAVAENVTVRRDWSLLLPRTEVTCATCGGHLGHVFGDGPGDCDRYCINSGALSFEAGESDPS